MPLDQQFGVPVIGKLKVSRFQQDKIKYQSNSREHLYQEYQHDEPRKTRIPKTLTYGAQLHSDKLCESDRTVLHHWQKLVDQRSTG